MEMIFASANEGKLREVREILDLLTEKYGPLGLDVKPMPEKFDIPETGNTYAENSLQKAQFIWDRYHEPCFADDSGLEVDELDGAPGIHTARYCGRNFVSGMDHLLAVLKERGALAPERRRAAFRCCITVIIDGVSHSFEGTCPGTISLEKGGEGGIGYDPVFIPDEGDGRTMAQMEKKGKNQISHRRIALEGMIEWLLSNKK